VKLFVTHQTPWTASTGVTTKYLSKKLWSADLFEVVLGLVVSIWGFTQALLQCGMPLVQLLLRHGSILGCQAVLHFSNDALPASRRNVVTLQQPSKVGHVLVQCTAAHRWCSSSLCIAAYWAAKLFSASAMMLCLQATITRMMLCLQATITSCNSPSRQVSCDAWQHSTDAAPVQAEQDSEPFFACQQNLSRCSIADQLW